ncbi:hypothetical protein GCM10020367_50920 [Streptomyces sannanensis]|uniref:LysR substrate-binding domain-containing protein n=1 Tax=Streptomyces sannanensis TaxID=285536 RepID=A0ABP6SHZ9_9ACTN
MGGTGGFRPSVRYDGTDVRALLLLVAAGRGPALLPHVTAAGVPGTVAVPLTRTPARTPHRAADDRRLRGAAETFSGRLLPG